MKSHIDFTKMYTWCLFILTLLFFSLFLILRQYDKAEVITTQVKVQSVEKKMDSLTIAQKVSDQMKLIQMKRIQREKAQLEEKVISHDVFIKQLKNDIQHLRKDEKNALHRIDGMSDEELMRYFKSLQKLDKPQ
ncbi:hypothetical protein [Xanthocytophaga flava]|uniref:hypothetical protein n=1 Tax=Xanthocytophaga flava TaxID=3048013 RepID=UPI0028D8B4D3|nr:hypothetical protein [Xanthocytophaga flavus]MDJ1468158.1 hypothetical protein [Xanthocytophaga flavus]